MNADKYIRDKIRLSQAMCGSANLEHALTDITAVLRLHNLDAMPEIALDVMAFTLETLHLEKFKASWCER